MRRNIGISGLQRNQQTLSQFREVGNALQTQQLEELRAQLARFKENLENFALKYKKDIKRDPAFRMHFQRMCNQIGVDPLACWLHSKGFPGAALLITGYISHFQSDKGLLVGSSWNRRLLLRTRDTGCRGLLANKGSKWWTYRLDGAQATRRNQPRTSCTRNQRVRFSPECR